jgi:sugar phosphate isomerase/epimerase
VPDGISVQWVPLGEGTVDFKAIVARAVEILPDVYVYCKPITARPPVVIPVYNDEFWTKWFPRGRSKDLERFIRFAKNGRPYDKAQVVEDVEGGRDRFMEALKIQQIEHMERSLSYCRESLDLGIRWRGRR